MPPVVNVTESISGCKQLLREVVGKLYISLEKTDINWSLSRPA